MKITYSDEQEKIFYILYLQLRKLNNGTIKLIRANVKKCKGLLKSKLYNEKRGGTKPKNLLEKEKTMKFVQFLKKY